MQDQCRGWCWSTGVSVAATGLEVAKSAKIKATNLNQNCYEQDDADDDRSDDDDDDDNDDDDAGFPTVGFPKAELISKLLNKISVRVDVSKSLKTYLLFENEILIDDIVVIFGIYGVDFPPKGSPKRS